MHGIYASSTAISLTMLMAITLLSACNRPNDDRTAGQKLDEAVQTTERKTAEMKADAQAAGKDMKQAAGDAADATATKAKDAAITAQIKTQLARDERLSAMSINVDTTGGQVLLKGTAPDAASRERATGLAKGVDGVSSVNNELTLKPAN
jgi:hyperosmotically inducible periplasmic protein